MTVTLRTVGELGALARAARRALGWTQEQAAREAGVSRQFIIALESGRHPNAELWRVLAVLSAVGVTLSGSVGDERVSRSGRPSIEPRTSSADSPRATPGDASEAEFDLDRHLATFADASPFQKEQEQAQKQPQPQPVLDERR